MPEAIYNELSVRLEKYISERELTGKLPGLHKLGKVLGANHITVRKAVELLVDKGHLEVVPSKGTFVCEKPSPRRNHGLIGVIGNSDSQHFREMLFERLNGTIAKSGYKAMDIANNIHLFFTNPRLLLQFPVDGYIFLGSSLNRAILDTLLENDIPVICTINPNFPEVNHIGMDHFDGYTRVLKLLLARGCRRIAFLGYERSSDFQNYIEDIRNIYISVLGDLFNPDLFFVSNAFTYYRRYEEAYHEYATRDAIKTWKNCPPDAVVTCPQTVETLKQLLPGVTTAGFADPSEKSACDIHAYPKTLELLNCAMNRMLELLAGDKSIKETKIPFTITQTTERNK